MKEVKHNGNHFLIYEGIDDMPMDRFFKFNLNIILDAGIGGDINAVLARNAELAEWVRRGRKEEALTAINNLDNAIATAMSGITPHSNAFVCLVAEANGEKVTDLTQDAMTRYLNEWGKKGLTFGKVKAVVLELKKKLSLRLRRFSQKNPVTQQPQ